jgi:replication factor A2
MDFQGGDGGSAGGGYTTNSYGGGGGGTQDTSSSDKKARRPYDEQTLIPITIQMAFKAHPDSSSGDGSLVLEDGRALHTVKIIGAVRGVEDTSTNIVYTIEDGTGVLEVKQWLDDGESTALRQLREQTAHDNVYIKVVGQIKDYDGKKILVANSVRPLTTGNELTHHFLEVMYSSEKFKRADSIVPPMMNFNNNAKTIGGNPQGAGGMGGGDGGSAYRQRILALIQEHDDDSEEGVSVDTCIQFLSDIPQAEIRRTLELLSEEGSIYSTVNESCFKFAA